MKAKFFFSCLALLGSVYSASIHADDYPNCGDSNPFGKPVPCEPGLPGATQPTLVSAMGLSSARITSISVTTTQAIVATLEPSFYFIYQLRSDPRLVNCVQAVNSTSEGVRFTVSGGSFATEMSMDTFPQSAIVICP